MNICFNNFKTNDVQVSYLFSFVQDIIKILAT